MRVVPIRVRITLTRLRFEIPPRAFHPIARGALAAPVGQGIVGNLPQPTSKAPALGIEFEFSHRWDKTGKNDLHDVSRVVYRNSALSDVCRQEWAVNGKELFPRD